MSNDFYGKNALYEYIKKYSPNNFVFYENTISLMLVVSPKTSDVIFLVVDDRSENLDEKYIKLCSKIVKKFCKALNVPCLWIKYKDEELKNDSQVIVSAYSQRLEEWNRHDCEIRSIKKFLCEESINVDIRDTPKQVNKPYNSKPSSNFHIWQRDYLDTNGFIIDIDLIRLDANGEILSLYELKRSYTDFITWLPYENDKNNYYAQSKLCEKMQIRYTVLFNHQKKDGAEVM